MNNLISFKPIAFIKNSRLTPSDDHWLDISTIELIPEVPEEAFLNITMFSHLEIIYFFHLVKPIDQIYAGHPRENPNFPKMGIFAQRKKDRPNPIGLTTVELVSHNGKSIMVKNLDALNGTPVLDIKPVMKEFLPQVETAQPIWVSELMQDYWK